MSSYENFIADKYAAFEPGFGEYFTGYRLPHAYIGAPTSINTSAQIREASKMLNTGLKIIEVGTVDPNIFEGIPKQHFKELARLADLTGTEITMHGPIVDLAGFGKEGWEEQERLRAEAQMKDVMEKAYDVNPRGNVPVTFHGGAIPIQSFRYIPPEERGKLLARPEVQANPELAEEIKKGRVRERLLAVNPETGRIMPVQFEEKYWPEHPEGYILDPKKRIDHINYTEWEQAKFKVAVAQEQKERLKHLISPEEYGQLLPRYQEAEAKIKVGVQPTQDEIAAFSRINQYQETIRTAGFEQYSTLREMFNDMIQFGFKAGEENLKKDFQQEVKQVMNAEAEKFKQLHPDFEQDLRRRGVEEKRIPEIVKQQAIHEYRDEFLNTLNSELISWENRLGNRFPEKWKPADEFAREKTAETAANVVLHAYKKFGEKAPVLALENYPDTVMGWGDESRDVIEAARKKFVEKAKKEGISEAQAKSAAEKLIGATFDFGHMNMLRKHGFPEDIVPEATKQLAKYIKKTHITDNFGFNDTHLPPGMGNVPLKKSLEELKHAGVKVPQIVEAGGFFAQFKTSPHPYVLEALGSPLYTYMASPYWNQARSTYSSYFSGYGEFLPDRHFKAYGSPSFASLPVELGGEFPGEGRQRFGAQQME